MSNPILSLYNLDGVSNRRGESPFSTLSSREQSISDLAGRSEVDIGVLGVGLTGAVVAHQCALRGIRVVALEPGYLGMRSLSWEPQVARLLKVRPSELLRARSVFKSLVDRVASHLVAPLRPDSHPAVGLASRIVGKLCPLRDLDEGLLIRETALAARQEGAIILAAAEIVYVEPESESGCVRVGWRDALSQKTHEIRAGGVVVDPSSGIIPRTRLGTALVKDTERVVAGAQRVYEVMPRSAKSGALFSSYELTDGSFVSVSRLSPERVEVTILFGRNHLESDELDRICLDVCVEAGWIVCSQSHSREVHGVGGRRFEVQEDRGIFTCLHRGPWDAFRSAEKIVKRLVSLSDQPRPYKRFEPRVLPGSEQAREVDTFRALARAHGLSEEVIEASVRRWRGRVRYIPRFEDGLRELCPGVLRGEVDLAVYSDLVVSIDDLMFGSLQLQYLPQWEALREPLSRRLSELSDS